TAARRSSADSASPSSGDAISPAASISLTPKSLAGAAPGAAPAASSLSSIMRSLPYDAADHLGGVIHHRDDAGVIDARRADDPDRADDLLAAVLVRRDD